MSQDDIIEQIPTAFQEVDGAIRYIKYSMIAAIAVFVVLLPVFYVHQQFYGLGSARRVIAAIRICVLIEAFLILPLFYCLLELGPPLKLHAYTVYNSKGDSWIYGWGRPVIGLVFVGVGVIGDMNMYPRILCILGCIHQIVMDGLSEFQVHNYYTQVESRGAPTGEYTKELLKLYFWRDLVSIGVCFLTILLMSYFSHIVGWGHRQRISYAAIVGGDMDRCSAMRQQREIRKRLQHRDDTKANELQAVSVMKAYRTKEIDYEMGRNRNVDVVHLEAIQRDVGGGEEMFVVEHEAP